MSAMRFDLEWLYDIYILEAWHVISIIFSVFFLCYVCLNAKKTALFYHYLALQIILLNWLICKVFKTIAPTAELKWAFIVGQYFTVCFLGSALLMFGYLYAKGKPLPLRVSIPLNVPPLFFFAVVATNERHHLFYATYDFWGDTFGPLFYAYSAMTYLYIAVGLYYCSTLYRKKSGPDNVQTRLLLAGIVIPLFVNFLYIADLIHPRFDITPVSFNLSLLLFAYAIYRYRFLDVVPLGISAAFHNLREGVMVYDRGGKILDMNDSLFAILGLNKEDEYKTVHAVNRKLNNAWPEKDVILDLAAALQDHTDSQQITGDNGAIRELVLTDQRRRHLSIHARTIITRHKRPWGCLCVFYDNTGYTELIEDLEEKNRQLALTNTQLQAYAEDLKRLSVLEERNRMAGEIHDLLGHSLVLVLNVLENSRMLAENDPFKAGLMLDKALNAAKAGMEELRHAFREADSGSDKSIRFLEDDLEQLAEEYRAANMMITVEVRAQRMSMPAEHYHMVFKICRESLNNALKHGRAGKVNIFIRVNRGETELFVLDNGAGCESFQKGHGIKAMQQRTEKLRGVFSCGSSGEKGFIVHARLPCL